MLPPPGRFTPMGSPYLMGNPLTDEIEFGAEISMRMSVCRAYVLLTLGTLGLLSAPATASAQYRPAATGVIGENYHIEASYNWWSAEPSLIVNSESLGILGTDIDLISDLGIEKHKLSMLTVTLKPAKKHRLRFQRLPIPTRRTRSGPALVRIQRPELQHRPAGDHDGGLHDVQLRLPVRLPVLPAGLRRRGHQSEIHQCRRQPLEPDRHGIHFGHGADSGLQLRRPRLRDPEFPSTRNSRCSASPTASANSSRATAAIPTSICTAPITSTSTSAPSWDTGARRSSTTWTSTPATWSSRGCISEGSFGTREVLRS